MSEKKTDIELTDDEETLQYFESLAVDDVAAADGPADDEIDWDRVRTSLRNIDRRKSFVEQVAETEYEKQLQDFLPRRLQEYRNYIPDDLEGKWIVHIWNRVVDAKLILQEKYGKYKKTKSSSKFISYTSFKDKYKNERSRQALELKIRRIAFYALEMSSSNKVYNPNDWTSFIGTNRIDEYDDITDAIIEQLNDGFKI